VTRHRVLIDVEFTIDEEPYKLAQLMHDASGISDVTDSGVRDAISRLLARVDWAAQGLEPLRSIVTTRSASSDGLYADAHVPADHGIGGP
jgi:hypothetical protein